MEVTWTIFKAFVNSRSISIQYVDIEETYWLFAIDGQFSLSCKLDKNAADTTEKLDFEDNFKSLGNKQAPSVNSPFASKAFAGKKLYKRVHGSLDLVNIGSNEILFACPYNWAKITNAVIVGGEIGDRVSFYVLDKAVSPLYGVPNAVLNQFAFDICVSKDYFECKSEFDADLYLNLQMKVVYTSISNKTIGVNFILNEVK